MTEKADSNAVAEGVSQGRREQLTNTAYVLDEALLDDVVRANPELRTYVVQLLRGEAPVGLIHHPPRLPNRLPTLPDMSSLGKVARLAQEYVLRALRRQKVVAGVSQGHRV